MRTKRTQSQENTGTSEPRDYSVEGTFGINCHFNDNFKLPKSPLGGDDSVTEYLAQLLKKIDSHFPWRSMCPVTRTKGSMYGNCPFGGSGNYTKTKSGFTKIAELTVKPIDMEIKWSQLHAYEKYLQTLAAELAKEECVDSVSMQFKIKAVRRLYKK